MKIKLENGKEFVPSIEPSEEVLKKLKSGSCEGVSCLECPFVSSNGCVSTGLEILSVPKFEIIKEENEMSEEKLLPIPPIYSAIELQEAIEFAIAHGWKKKPKKVKKTFYQAISKKRGQPKIKVHDALYESENDFFKNRGEDSKKDYEFVILVNPIEIEVEGE